MNDDSRAVAENFDYAVGGYSASESVSEAVISAPEIPEYLQDTYWWAYLHPKSFYFFEREWVVNLILWGNMRRLTDSVLKELSVEPKSRVLQVACVYGDFSNRVATHLGKSGSHLDIVDVAPIQIENIKEKTAPHQNVGVHHQDSTSMTFPAGSFKVIFVDYHGPKRRNPMRYIMKPILRTLEPYAMDLWHDELPAFMPATVKPGQIRSDFYFGGLYQKIVLTV
jgi:SAM-dependent methyltransferase